MERIRVRIGPSPTGEPHVGTAWITLFNLAFARRHGGKLVLRIEDTDQERSRPEWEQEIMHGLRWLGLSWDEGPDVGGPYGPYRQSERRPLHQAHAELLVERGHAYRCFCTKERLDSLRETQRANKSRLGYDGHCRELTPSEIGGRIARGEPFTIRMKMPLDGETVVHDRLRGEVRFPNENVDDQVLLKSDGFPTYHLANVVDDHLMEISHVIRAEEWISSTPKHVILYSMFGWTPPVFVHLPLLRNKDTSKISKRKNPVSILDYKQRGFLPEAVINFLGLLGFSMPDGREMFSLAEFIEAFDLDRVSLTGPVFDLEKLTWLNGKYFRERLSDDDITNLVHDQILSRQYLRRIVPLIRERIDVGEQFIAATDYFFRGDLDLDPSALIPKGRPPKEVREVLETYTETVEAQVDFSPPALEALTRQVAERVGWTSGVLFTVLRLAITGRSASPPLFDTLSVLGRALVRRRLRAAMAAIASMKARGGLGAVHEVQAPTLNQRNAALNQKQAALNQKQAALSQSMNAEKTSTVEAARADAQEVALAPEIADADKVAAKAAAKAERRSLVAALKASGTVAGAATALGVTEGDVLERIAHYHVKPVEWSRTEAR